MVKKRNKKKRQTEIEQEIFSLVESFVNSDRDARLILVKFIVDTCETITSREQREAAIYDILVEFEKVIQSTY